MLTADLDRLGVSAGDVVLDLGCGRGRHAFAAARRGATVVAMDLSHGDLVEVAGLTFAMDRAGELGSGGSIGCVRGDGVRLPFADDAFDHVIAAEVLEHIPDDVAVMTEVARITKPGGGVAVTVPRYWPERICWALSGEYRRTPGGHVRIYRRHELVGRLARAGLQLRGSHHAHALHSPYWWLRCALGLSRESASLTRLYHRLLVWDIERKPAITRKLERVLDPVAGKSLVVYARKGNA